VSFVSLEDVKADLRIIHNQDDLLLQSLIDSAEQECLRFVGRDQLPTLPIDYPADSSSEEIPTSEDPVAPDVCRGIILMVRSDYDEVDPQRRPQWRAAAESLWMPYRVGLGV
jgi:hypothetical protein